MVLRCVGSIGVILGCKCLKNGRNTHSGHFSGSPTGRNEVLPVELRYWSFLAKSDRSDLKSYR